MSFFQRHRISILHLTFWCVYSLFFFFGLNEPRHGIQPDIKEVLIDTVQHVSMMMIISYINFFYVLPPFLKNRNAGQYLLRFLTTFIPFVFIYVILERYVKDGYTYHERYFYSTGFIQRVILTTFFIVMFVCLLKLIQEWFELDARKKELENEKLTTELQFLKAQINPHFLFNTLNNLYFLAFTQSPNTAEVVVKLSQMMRYMIYESNHEKVPLSKEIEYIQNYISLEKLRLEDNFPVSFEVQGNAEGVRITPLILITFVENAFKHGVTNNIKAAYVSVKIILADKNCIFSVENSKIPQQAKNVKEKSGIGLQNVKRRLALSYPDNYTLEVEDKPTFYKVQLLLHLD